MSYRIHGPVCDDGNYIKAALRLHRSIRGNKRHQRLVVLVAGNERFLCCIPDSDSHSTARECALRAHANLQLPQAEYCFVLGQCYQPECKCGLNYVEQSAYHDGTWLTSNSRTFPGSSIAPMLDLTIRQQRSIDYMRAYLSGEAPLVWAARECEGGRFDLG
jgi:hypothetical protein